jgi:hypothetical protein
MSGDGMAGSAKLLPDVVLSHAACFPSAIEMFKPLADEPSLGLVAENEIGVGDRPRGEVIADFSFGLCGSRPTSVSH